MKVVKIAAMLLLLFFFGNHKENFPTSKESPNYGYGKQFWQTETFFPIHKSDKGPIVRVFWQLFYIYALECWKETAVELQSLNNLCGHDIAKSFNFTGTLNRFHTIRCSKLEKHIFCISHSLPSKM